MLWLRLKRFNKNSSNGIYCKCKAVKMRGWGGYLERILPPIGVPGPKKFGNPWYTGWSSLDVKCINVWLKHHQSIRADSHYGHGWSLGTQVHLADAVVWILRTVPRSRSPSRPWLVMEVVSEPIEVYLGFGYIDAMWKHWIQLKVYSGAEDQRSMGIMAIKQTRWESALKCLSLNCPNQGP